MLAAIFEVDAAQLARCRRVPGAVAVAGESRHDVGLLTHLPHFLYLREGRIDIVPHPRIAGGQAAGIIGDRIFDGFQVLFVPGSQLLGLSVADAAFANAHMIAVQGDEVVSGFLPGRKGGTAEDGRQPVIIHFDVAMPVAAHLETGTDAFEFARDIEKVQDR